MNEANKINKQLNLDIALPVIRHGDEVEYTNKNILDIINELKEKYKTIAIITKDVKESQALYNKLNNKIYINLIDKDNINFNSDINILPSYLKVLNLTQ